ncbi:MAG: ATP-binding protein [Anaerolineales bacterium]
MNPRPDEPKPAPIWQGLSTQMFLLVILPFAVLALAATLMSLGLHQNAMRAMSAENDTHTVEMAARFMESKIQAEQEIVSALALYLALQNGSDTGKRSAFAQQHDLTDKNLAYLSAQGKILAFSGTSAAQDVLRSLSPYPNKMQVVSNANKRWYLWQSATVETGGTAVSLAPLDLMVLKSLGMSGNMADMGDSAIFLGDARGQVLVFFLGDKAWNSNLATHLSAPAEALRGESGFTYVQAGGVEHVMAYSPVSPGGWVLATEGPWESANTPYLRLTQFAPLILLPLLAFTLVALWFSLSQIIGPLRRLETRAAELAWGDFAAIEQPAGGVREITQLQNTLIHMARKVQDSQQSLHDYIGAMTRGQEDERRRLARELHDETLQSLIALRQRVQLAQMKTKEADSQKSLAELESLSSSTIDELRRLTRALRPIYLEDLGLVTALEMLAREAAPLEVTFLREGIERRLDAAVELSLFRIAQEALNNVAHHAAATQAWVRINFQPEAVTLEIGDNGHGFVPPRSPAEFAPGGHYGLLGMHERVELIGGKLTIESAPGKGTHLKIHLPAVAISPEK